MPARQSRILSATTSKPRHAPRKADPKRSLNAYTIAAAAEKAEEEDLEVNPSAPRRRRRVPANRLGEVEDEPFGRPGGSEDGDGEDGEQEWRVGEVGTDDDSELDSDEAFGESDEERFEGFTFRGSAGNEKTTKARKSKVKEGGLLNEDGEIDEDEEGDDEIEDDFGDEAVGLDTLLDDAESDSEDMDDEGEEAEEEEGEKSKKRAYESDSDISISDNEDGTDAKKLSSLRTLVETLQDEEDARQPKRRRVGQAIESMDPSEHAITSTTKLTLADMMDSVTDPQLRASLALLNPAKDKASVSKTKSTIPGKLEVPLPKRQQDRMDRSAAYKKSKESLDRWIDTVKHNRRAAHLSFPLKNPNGEAADSFKRLSRANPKTFTKFEAKLQKIMRDSGLDGGPGAGDEEKFMALEEMQVRKFSAKEVETRRAEMRKARDLIFREEQRAKRIKKIKSKAYRRVNRKRRRREEEEDLEAMENAEGEMGEIYRETVERLRAEQRMGAKMNSSKWAKAMRKAANAVGDEDLRDDLAVELDKQDILLRRMKGDSAADGRDGLDSSEESDFDSGDEAEDDNLLVRLDRANGTDEPQELGRYARLANQPFMKRAREARKKENDDLIEDVRRTLNGSDASSREASPDAVGRRTYEIQDTSKPKKHNAKKLERQELDEGFLSGDEDARDGERALNVESTSKRNTPSDSGVLNIILDQQPPSGTTHRALLEEKETLSIKLGQPAVSSKPKRTETGKANGKAATNVDSDFMRKALVSMHIEPANMAEAMKAASLVKKPTSSPRLGKNTNGPARKIIIKKNVKFLDQGLHDKDSNSESDNETYTKNNSTNMAMLDKAFAGDEVATQFAKEKQALMEEEDDQIIDKTLPGWGSWTGDGVGKRQLKRQKKIIEVVKGVAKDKRKDAKLERVMINEKRVKKNAKYLASTLPHPFESQQQYERALRLPVGPEWTTKETFQKATKPRVLIKQGVIAPMSKPLL
ncbi:MAG: hypothetical protein M1814_004251 [Vezdaea aestivalis]|nr:MAG: hypothetical protein M1814_004251 [Vezdaea aestivalis]